MQTPRQHPTRKCCRCGDELPGGVRFCIACGTNNFDPAAGALASAQLEIELYEKRSFWERFTFWYRYFTSGIRR